MNDDEELNQYTTKKYYIFFNWSHVNKNTKCLKSF